MLPPSRPSRTTPRSSAMDPDDAIRATDDDAAASRLSAINLGYLPDPYLQYLYRPSLSSDACPSRKAPLINVGTHHRTVAVDMLVQRFFASGGKQVLSLGAGSDTRYWRLTASETPPDIQNYVEVDFPHQTSQKAQRIARSVKLHEPLADPAEPSARPYVVSGGGTTLRSKPYSLIPLDLRDPSALDALNAVLDPELPTLLLAECVFCYMRPEETNRILEWFGRFKRAAAVVYEMIGLDDQFGQVMKRNLATRNLSLPGAIYKTPQQQAERFLSPELHDGAFESAESKTLWSIRTSVISNQEIQRISALEHLDEIEELKLVLDHYCVTWASRGDGMKGVGI